MCFTTWLIHTYLQIPTENHPRAGHAGDRTHDLWVIFGGAGNSEKFNDVLAYEFKTNKWKTLHSGKDLCRYGRNTQICQLQGRGDSKHP